ncbi:MAG: hypothetical protein ACFWUM_01955 [Eubacteriales bacterium]|jgi:O-antigen biosynthesis protein
MGKYDFGYTVYDGSTVQWALKTIQSNSMVLEFGPYNGNLTKHLKEELNCKVDIVEIDQEAGSQAAKFAENALIGPEKGDIEKYYWCDRFQGKKYDYIVFLDVLEHLYDTKKVLSTVKKFLKDNGSVLLSIPNIAHNSIILSLIKNEFNYTSLGLLDNTHIRFFTYHSILQLADILGYSAKVSALQLAVGNNEISSSYEDVNKEVANYLKQRPYANVYQYLVELKKREHYEYHSDLEINNIDNQKQFVVYIMQTNDIQFSEDKAIRFWIEPNHIDLKINFADFSNLKFLRIDPMDCCCILTNVEIITDGHMLNMEQLHVVNGKKLKNGKFIFMNDDPQIFIDECPKGIKTLCFKCDVELYDDPFIQVEYNLLEELDHRNAKINQLLNRFKSLQNLTKQFQSNIEILKAQNESLKSENKIIKEENKSLKLYNETLRKQNQLIMEEFNTVSAIKDAQDDQLYNIYNSKSWKMITRYRNIKHKLWRK